VHVTAPLKLGESYGKKHREVKYVIIIAILDYLMAGMTGDHPGRGKENLASRDRELVMFS
jgi:hypothetical protein